LIACTFSPPATTIITKAQKKEKKKKKKFNRGLGVRGLGFPSK